MKRFLLLFVAFIATSICFAQDVIVKKDGTVINAKVLTVDESVISYKKWENLEGPTYTINKDSIYSIMYANGTKEILSQASNETPIQQSNVSMLQELQKNSTNENKPSVGGIGVGKIVSGWCLIGIIGIPGIVGGVIAMCADADAGAYMILTGAVATGLGCGLIANGKKARRDFEKLHSSIKLPGYNFGEYALTPSIDVYTDPLTKKKSYGGGLCFTF